MNLYLDDVRSPPDDSWTLVRTAEEARTIIASGVVECASLDHDLGECDDCSREHDDDAPVPSKCRHRMTGYDLVKWMALTGRWPKRKPIVHSASKTGRANMIAAIERYFPRQGECDDCVKWRHADESAIGSCPHRMAANGG